MTGTAFAPQEEPPQSGELQPGDLVDGKYRVEAALGRGVSSRVFRAVEIDPGRSVALKVLDKPDRAIDVRREERVLSLASHPHLVEAYGFGMHQGRPYLAMELVEGSDLFHILADLAQLGERAPVEWALDTLSAIAEALDAVHAAGFVHRDVKPENVLVAHRTGRPVLVDLGLALPHASDTSGRGSGTLLYMAPEQLTGGRLSPATDTYGLACVAYHLLASKPPPPPVVPRGVNAPLPSRPPAEPLATSRPELAALDPVLFRGLATDPERRQATSGAFARELMAAAGYEPPAPPRGSLGGASLRVLVADDDPLVRRAAEKAVHLAFAEGPVSVATASTGAEALAEIGRSPPHLLVLDVALPDMDGPALLAAARRLPGGRSISVLVVTGTASPRARARLAPFGVLDVMEKGAGFAQLVDHLRRLGTRPSRLNP